jgi:hypothetical protein
VAIPNRVMPSDTNAPTSPPMIADLHTIDRDHEKSKWRCCMRVFEAVSAVHHMIDRSWILHSEFTSHIKTEVAPRNARVKLR